MTTRKKVDKRLGYIYEPIFEIEFNRCIPGILHLIFRISEKLFECVIAKLNFKDKNNSAYLSKRPILAKFFTISEFVFLEFWSLYCIIKDFPSSSYTTQKLDDELRNWLKFYIKIVKPEFLEIYNLFLFRYLFKILIR